MMGNTKEIVTSFSEHNVVFATSKDHNYIIYEHYCPVMF